MDFRQMSHDHSGCTHFLLPLLAGNMNNSTPLKFLSLPVVDSLPLNWQMYPMPIKLLFIHRNPGISQGSLWWTLSPILWSSLIYRNIYYVELQCVNSEPLFLCGLRVGVFICLPVAGFIMASHSVPQWQLHMCLKSIHSVVLSMLPLYTQKGTTHILAVMS